MVPAGNPDKLKQAFADAFGVYSIEGLNELPAGDFKEYTAASTQAM